MTFGSGSSFVPYASKISICGSQFIEGILFWSYRNALNAWFIANNLWFHFEKCIFPCSCHRLLSLLAYRKRMRRIRTTRVVEWKIDISRKDNTIFLCFSSHPIVSLWKRTFSLAAFAVSLLKGHRCTTVANKPTISAGTLNRRYAHGCWFPFFKNNNFLFRDRKSYSAVPRNQLPGRSWVEYNAITITRMVVCRSRWTRYTAVVQY